jgi:hypothetical protein
MYLFVLVNGKISEIQEMFKLLWKKQLYNVNIMYEDKYSEILIETFIPFSPKSCNDTTPIIINRFKNGKFVIGTENFFPEKMKNLFECPVRLAVFDSKPFLFFHHSKNGELELDGRDALLAKALANDLNFNIDIKVFKNYGYFYPNGTSIGPLKALMDGEVDMSIQNWYLKMSRIPFLGFSTSYFSEQIVLVVPPAKKLSALEEFLYPFSWPIWIMVVAYFLVGILVIFTVKRKSKVIQDFLFGENVSVPYLNLFIGFIGGAQTVLPKYNFARFLLMIFLLYSLIIRTAYQASFYELLKSNMHHKEIQSIDDILDRQFTIYCVEGNEDLLNWSEALNTR